jgi:molybdopterin/thiamine biosynthesis adenylyltransferase/nitroreductase
LDEIEVDRGIDEFLQGRPRKDYGRWIYYPWSGRLVHTLEAPEYRFLRLNRNRNKITPEEQERLAHLSVGIVGLSVGNAVAIALAMEGIGHLRLADFDRLDLSNMNRLRASVHEIGVPKTMLAARQIYEIDPYASVTLLNEGIDKDNIGVFFAGHPCLDIVVEECDSVPIKFLVRERARELRVPVLMQTSDRGMFDAERFDIEPDRASFHGLAGLTTSSDIAQATREERVALVLKLMDPEQLSQRLAGSLPEVDRTLSTWPQLASDVALGAATVGTAVRRIALGAEVPSGRRFIDIDRAITCKIPASRTSRPVAAPRSTTNLHQTDTSITDFIRFIAENATLAPSGGNCQPWMFHYDAPALWIARHPVRSENLMDTGAHGPALLALGAAIENAVIAAAYLGHRAEVEPFPDCASGAMVAAVRFHRDHEIALSEVAAAFPWISKRVTNRRRAERVALAPEVCARLRGAALEYGADLELITNSDELDEMGRILGEADRVRFLCRELHAEVVSELRWTPDEAKVRRDGVDVATLELSPVEFAAMRVIARPDVAAFLRERDEGTRLLELAESSIAASSAVGLLTLRQGTPEAWLQGGRALQRMWLQATASGLAVHPWTSLPYMIDMLHRPVAAIFNARERSTLQALNTRLGQLFFEVPEHPRAFLFRLACAPQPTARSVRLPVDSVLRAGLPLP